MTRTLSFLGQHPWLPLVTVVTCFVLVAIPIAMFVVLFFLGEAAIGR